MGWGFVGRVLLFVGCCACGLATELRREASAHETTAISTRAVRHPISKMAGTFFVSRARVSVRLKLYVEDLFLFHESVQPDEQDRVYADSLLPAVEDHKQFLLDRIRILDADGVALPSRVVAVSDLKVPDEGWGTDELMEHTLDFDLEYDLATPPEFLTVVQDVVDENFVFPSELEMLLRQEGNDAVEAKILRPGEPYTTRFVWNRPALDATASREQFEELLEQDREELLGITSYDAIYSFLYITRLEVRHEILIPLATLSTVVDLPHADPNQLKIDEQKTARELIRQYYLGGNPVKIDGVEVSPIVDRIDFYGLNLKDFAVRAEPRDVSLASGRVGVILRYPAKQEPSEVEMTWTQFNSSIRKISTVVFAMQETLKAEFSRFQTENTFTWKNPNPNLEPRGIKPVPAHLPSPPNWSPLALGVGVGILAIALLTHFLSRHSFLSRYSAAAWIAWSAPAIAMGVAAWPGGWIPIPGAQPEAISEAERVAITRGLIANVYRAFDYSAEEEIYDALARTSEGDLLTELYLEVRRGLTVQDQGGAMATVDAVEFVQLAAGSELKPIPPAVAPASPGFVAQGRWNVGGTIEHWGHVHRRVNQYEGTFLIQAIDGEWKLTGLSLTDEQRLENRRSLRRF